MSKKRITKVYTRTGDDGSTSLVGGKRVSKSSSRVQSYGDVDELNASIGLARKEITDRGLLEIITEIQNDLFILGADLASPSDVEVPRVSEEMIDKLEKHIDNYLKQLEPLREFILPAGKGSGAYLHFARTISRRAERSVVRLMEEEKQSSHALSYLNRLSDLLFVLARIANESDNFDEVYVDFNK